MKLIMKGLHFFFAVLVFVALASFGCKRNLTDPVWQIKLKSRPYAEPISEGDRFYIFSQAGEAIAGMSQTGHRLWSQKLSGAILATPAISNDSIFVATENGDVYRIKKENGLTLWKISLKDRFISPPLFLKDAVILGSETGSLYAVSAKDGSLMWHSAGHRKFSGRPAGSGNSIFVGDWQNQFSSFKLDGTLNWRFQASTFISNEGIVLRNSVFFPAYDQYVYSLDAQTGKLRWRYPAQRPSNLVILGDSQSNPEIVFASGNDFVFLSAQDGKLLRRIKFGKLVNRLYSRNSEIYAIDGAVHQINPVDGTSSVVIRARNPIHKLTFAPGMILASDDLYSIYGYTARP